ncbi:MAG TPA: SPOR domain-containing protein [Thermoanaerobacterales bacterium]|nr:SPOR domain-containing protein [Thermoanaerobacterales bacterium]
MRKKRSEKSGGIGKGKTLLLLFVIIPLLGVALGYGVAKMLIIPYFAQNQQDEAGTPTGQTSPKGTSDPGEARPPDDGVPQSPTEDEQAVSAFQQAFKVEGFELYRIQVGAFSNPQNALKLAEELNNNGMAAAVDEDGLHKVYTLYSFSRELAEAAVDKVRAHYSDAHISKTSFPSVEINFSQSYSREASMLRDQLEECKDMLKQVSAAEAAGKSIEDMIEEHKNRIGLFEVQISQTEWPASMEVYKEEILMLYTAMLDTYSEYDSRTAVPGQVSMELINCYIEVLKRISRVI